MKYFLLIIIILLPVQAQAQTSDNEKPTKSAIFAAALARSLADAYARIDLLEAEVAQLKAAASKPKDTPP